MRTTRMVAAALLAASLSLPAPASAASAVTLHGTFDSGAAYAAAAGATPVFGLPLGGDWNLNMTVAGGTVKATAQFIVRFVPADAELGFPAHGLHALWKPSFLTLQPLTSPSPAAAVIADAAGVVYDPAHGVYAFTADLPSVDFVVVADTRSGHFFYAAVAAPPLCPVDAPFCYDSVQVSGTIGR